MSLLAILGVTYSAIALLLFSFQHQLVFLPDIGRTQAGTPAQAGLTHAPVEIATADGERLSAWLVDAAGPDPVGRGVVLFFHGNAGNLAARVDNLRVFSELGWRTLIVSYRGFGSSTGVPSEQGTYADADAAWRYLTTQLGVPADRIVVYGESLGSGVATWLASRERVAGLVTMGAFTSIPDLGQELYPWLPVRLLARIRYDNIDRIASVTAPVLLIHSRDDELVPFAHTERLASAALAAEPGRGAPLTVLELRGSHNTALGYSAAEYRAGLKIFLDAIAR